MKELRVFVLSAFALGFASAALAQLYPAKPIKIVIPFPPGNTMDIMTRLIAPKMSERLGQPIVAENRPGASGMLGLDFVAKAAPDGYTLAAGQGGNLVVLPHTSKNIPYDALKDFLPIAVSTTNYLGIVAYPEVPFKSIGEMISYAKANPGKLTVATNGEGGFPHLAFEHLRVMGSFTFTHVPYKGSAARAFRSGPTHRRRPRRFAATSRAAGSATSRRRERRGRSFSSSTTRSTTR